ncbi:MAG: hypothetical protein GY913_05775 [Proteobacteria bacterium]|nr:hypothetical protein [Pseudomonadota bacterium]MCP4916413.1 hypothetical protein [Pseudomonadota bacterium]
MISLLALACGDKDTDTTGDSSAVEDSDIRDSDPTDSDDPKDSGEPTECTLGAVSPLTIPIETEGSTVTVQFDCVPESVTLDGDTVSFDADGTEVVVQASGLKNKALVAIVLSASDGDHTTSVRGHSTELDLEKPEDLHELDGVEDLVIDEREMTTGADWDYRVQPFGPAQDGIVALAWHGEDGLGLTYLDLDDPADDEGRLRKQPDVLTADWDELIDESIEQLQDNPLASMTPGDGSFTAAESEELPAFSEELAGPALVVTVPWDTGTDCKLATVLLGGGDDVDTMWETAQVLSTGTDADCLDLAMPLGSADLFGDGGWTVVMSDGTAYRLNKFTIPEKVVMEKDGDFYGMTAGDLNGDGLGDAVLYGDELQVWLSDGKGSSLAYEGDLPTWIWYPIAAGVSPGTGQPATAPMSWSVMVD